MKRRQPIKQEQKDLQPQVQRATRSRTAQMEHNTSITQTKKKQNQARDNSEGIEPPQRKQVKTQLDGAKKQKKEADVNEKSVLETLISLKNNKDNVSYKKLNESLEKKCNIDSKEQKEQINAILDSLQKDYLIVQQKTVIHLNNEEEIQLDRCKGALLDQEDNLSVVPTQVPTQVYNLNQFQHFLRQESRQVIIQTALKKQDYQSLFSRKPVIKELQLQWDINAVLTELELLNLTLMEAKTENNQFGIKEGKLIKLSIDSSQNRIGFNKEKKKRYNRQRPVLEGKNILLLHRSIFAFSRLRYLSLSIYSHQGNEETQNEIYQFLISVPLNLVVLKQFRFICQQSRFEYLLDTLNEIEKNEEITLREPFEELSIIFRDKKVERVTHMQSEMQGLQPLGEYFHGQCSYNLMVLQDQTVSLKENHDSKQIKLVQDRATKLKELQYEIRQINNKTDDCKVILDTLSNAHSIRKVNIQYTNLVTSSSDAYPRLDKDYPELNHIEISQIIQVSELGPTDVQRKQKFYEELPKILDRHLDHIVAIRRQPFFSIFYRIHSSTNDLYVQHKYDLSSNSKKQNLEINMLQRPYLKPLRSLLSEMFTFQDFCNSMVFNSLGDAVSDELLTVFIDVLNKTQQKIKLDLSLIFLNNLEQKTSQLINELIMVASQKCSNFILNLSRTPNHLISPYIKQWLSELRQVNASNFALDIKFGKVWGTLRLSEINDFLIMIMFLRFNLTVDLQQPFNYNGFPFQQQAQETFNRIKEQFLSNIHQRIPQLKLKRKIYLTKTNSCDDVLRTLKTNRCFFSDIIKSQI